MSDPGLDTEFKRGLGLFDATMVVMGSMIGSGIFIVSADMLRRTGSSGWLLVAWGITGVLTVAAALSYGELAAMMPRAGGQYVYLREAFSPLVGFLYGWTLFLVIQTGTIAAVAVAFAKFLGVFWPFISENNSLIEPIHLSSGYAISLSTAQLVGVLLIAVLTLTNLAGLRYGKWIQNLFTVAKTGALLGLILLGLILGWRADALSSNFSEFWTPHATEPTVMTLTAFGVFVALCVAQTGSLFSSDAWNNITFTAGEVREPRRTLPLALAIGTSLVILLYLLANVVYLITLSHDTITFVPGANDPPAIPVGTAAMQRLLPGLGVAFMAGAIMISTFGCANGLVLAGARAYYAMARDRLFFRHVGVLNKAKVPSGALILQGIWAAALVLPRTYTPGKGYGSLYNDLLDYVISAALLFYVLTILGLFRLRWLRPQADRPYRAFGYPWVPGLYIVGASVLLIVLLIVRPQTTWPGLFLVALGIPVFYLWGGARRDNPLAVREMPAWQRARQRHAKRRRR